MSRIAYVNGRYVPHRGAFVHVDDRGYQFADAVYEVIYLCAGRFIDADRHLARLDRSLRELRLTPPLGRPALLRVLTELARRNRIATGLLYMQITRGVSRREHAFPAAGTASTLVATLRRLPPFPASIDQWTTSAITVPDQRWGRCDIKTTNLLANVLARQAASDQGATEALLIDANGNLTEGASTSVWVVDAQGRLLLRHQDAAILPGCTRAVLEQLLSEDGITIEQAPCSLETLRTAREIFLTSATSFVKPVLKLDGAPVGDGAIGPVARLLFSLLARHVQTV